MAKILQFNDPEDKKVFKVVNSIADVVPSHTVIYSNKGFIRYRILDKVESIDVDSNRVRVNYNTGYYLMIQA
jgi:hypothetical protein